MKTRNEAQNRTARIPACSIFEEEDVVVARLEMPGVPKDGLEIKIEGNELAISGARRPEELDGRPNAKYLLRERRYDSYRKLFTLDDSIAKDRIDAVLENGVLTLKMHIKEASKPRKIEVN